MRRFFHPTSANDGDTIVLTGPEAHHASQVIRLREGDDATILDGAGGEYSCTVTDVGRKEVQLRVKRCSRHERRAGRIRLVQAITKGKSFEVILQKAVELGAAEVLPVITDRVIARPTDRELDDKREKWRQVAVEAIKQCGSCWLPEILPPSSFHDALAADAGGELRLVAALRDGAAHLRSAVDGYAAAQGRLPTTVSIWVGPEGDFTPGELDALEASGAKPVTLGANILRSETAALSALACLQHELTAPR